MTSEERQASHHAHDRADEMSGFAVVVVVPVAEHMTREACVSEVAAASGEQVSTVSHRLRVLRSEGLVERRRDGRHIYYSLADSHVIEMIRNALDHVDHHRID